MELFLEGRSSIAGSSKEWGREGSILNMEGRKMGDESYIEVGWIFRWGNNSSRSEGRRPERSEVNKFVGPSRPEWS